MENDAKKIRKVARCIQTLLESEGVKIAVIDVFRLIETEDLTDVPRLKSLVANNYALAYNQDNDRRNCLKAFIIKNWGQVKDSDPVRAALLNAYCMGRYNKEKRQRMVSELLAKCEE